MTMLQVPVHPGEILKHDYLEELGISAGALAKRIGVPRTRIERLCKEEVSLTVDTALRLSRAFGTTVEFWMNLQLHYDVLTETEKVDLSDIEPLIAA